MSTRFQLNRHIKVYTIILLTTFPQQDIWHFYHFATVSFERTKYLYKSTYSYLYCFSIGWLMNADFLLPKIEEFISSAQKGIVHHQGYRKLYEANRILSFKLLTDKF